jgi:hypothetical protein
MLLEGLEVLLGLDELFLELEHVALLCGEDGEKIAFGRRRGDDTRRGQGRRAAYP